MLLLSLHATETETGLMGHLARMPTLLLQYKIAVLYASTGPRNVVRFFLIGQLQSEWGRRTRGRFYFSCCIRGDLILFVKKKTVSGCGFCEK